MFELTKEHNYRKDLHYHVIAGEGRWMPRDFGHPDSVHSNVIFPDKSSAHRTFLGLVEGLSPAELDEGDHAESEEIWYNIVDEVEKEHVLEVITYLGMEYHDGVIPIALIACNGCIPYGMN